MGLSTATAVRAPLNALMLVLVLAANLLLGACSSAGTGRVSGPPSPTQPPTVDVPFPTANYARTTAQQGCGDGQILVGGGWSSDTTLPELYDSWPGGTNWMVTAASPVDAPIHAEVECHDAAGGSLQTAVYSAESELTSSARVNTLTVRCHNASQTALSGGFWSERDLVVISSAPVDGQGWQVTFGGVVAGSVAARAYVVCLNARRESRIVNGPNLTLDYFRIATSVAQCPDGFEATGGGFQQAVGGTQIIESAGGMDGRNTWNVSAQRVFVYPNTIMASVYCVKF